MTEVTCNHEVTCDFCGREFPVADVETNDQGQAVCKTCLEDGTAKICAECGSFQYSENMHFVVGLHVEVCDECWCGPYGSPEEESLTEEPEDAPPAFEGCSGCPGEEGGCMEHPAECGRYDPETGKKVW